MLAETDALHGMLSGSLLPAAAACLKSGTTFDQLDAVATARSDNEAARALSQARERLFRSLDPAA